MATICFGDNNVSFEDLSGSVAISQILPFRVRFESLSRGKATPGFQVPPIGIAILGVNNYIL
jgi:hypothetical protein